MGMNLQLSQHLKFITSPAQVVDYLVTPFGLILMFFFFFPFFFFIELVVWRVAEYSV